MKKIGNEKKIKENLHSLWRMKIVEWKINPIHFCQNALLQRLDIMFEKVYLNQYLQKTSNDGKTVFIKV